MDNFVEIYTDGSCWPNPGGFGGWAAIVRMPSGEETELSGGADVTTNNRMELMAVICALESLSSKTSFSSPLSVVVYSDSKYVVNPIHGQKVAKWAAQEKRINRDLWERLKLACVALKVRALWVQGHAGHRENERCDQLAEMERTKRGGSSQPTEMQIRRQKQNSPKRIAHINLVLRKEKAHPMKPSNPGSGGGHREKISGNFQDYLRAKKK